MGRGAIVQRFTGLREQQPQLRGRALRRCSLFEEVPGYDKIAPLQGGDACASLGLEVDAGGLHGAAIAGRGMGANALA